MPLLNCPHCDQPIEAEAELAGAVADCPTCGGQFIVPEIDQAIAPEMAEESPGARTTPMAKSDLPPPVIISPVAPPKLKIIGAASASAEGRSPWPRRALWATLVGWLIGAAYYGVTLQPVLNGERGFAYGTAAYALGQSLFLVVASALLALAMGIAISLLATLLKKETGPALCGAYIVFVLLAPALTVAWLSGAFPSWRPDPFVVVFIPEPMSQAEKGAGEAFQALLTNLQTSLHPAAKRTGSASPSEEKVEAPSPPAATP